MSFQKLSRLLVDKLLKDRVNVAAPASLPGARAQPIPFPLHRYFAHIRAECVSIVGKV